MNQFDHNFVLEYHQKTGKQLKNYDDCRLRLSIILSDLGLKLEAQVGSTETSCFDLAILLFTQSRSQGTVDKMLTRWRPDLSATVEEAEDTLRRLAQRIINAQHRYVAAPRSWRELVGASGAEALKRQNLTANRIRWNFCLCRRPMAVLCVFGDAVSLPSTYNVVTHHAQRKGWPDRCTLSAVSCSAFHSNGVDSTGESAGTAPTRYIYIHYIIIHNS